MPTKLLYLGEHTDFAKESLDKDTEKLILDALKQFEVKSEKIPNSDKFKIAERMTAELFTLPEEVKVLHLLDLFEQDLNMWTESPGLPWQYQGYKTKGDIKQDPEAIRRVRKFAHFVKDGKNLKPPDCQPYVQGRVPENKEKVHAMWCYPATTTFIEAMFALPLIRAFQKLPEHVRQVASGFQTVAEGMCCLNKRFRRDGLDYTGIDFKKFDETVPTWFIKIAFNVLMLNIDFVYYEHGGVADASKLIRLYDYVRDYFISTTIRLPNGNRYQKCSGIPSGSLFAGLIRSIINCVIVNWLSLEQYASLPIDHIFLGDTSLVLFTRVWDLRWCHGFLANIGMQLDIDPKAGKEDKMKRFVKKMISEIILS